MQAIQDYLTLAIELVSIFFFIVIASDILNKARYIGGYYIPTNWQAPAMIPVTDAQVKVATLVDEAAKRSALGSSRNAPLLKFRSESVITSAINSTSSSEVQLPDPWTLPVDELLVQPLSRLVQAKITEPMLLLPPARQPQLKKAQLKLYKLHKHSVVRVEDLPVPVPPGLKRYQMHGQFVVRLAELEAAIA